MVTGTNLRKSIGIEITGDSDTERIIIMFHPAFTRQGSEVQNLSRLPIKSSS
jgi:hypothetical protein